MSQPLLLNRTALADFVACPRRFQLRYLVQAPWPSSPLDAQQSRAFERGRQFHRLIEQHLLGLKIADETIDDPLIREWWHSFLAHRPTLSGDRLFPEHRLTVPAGNSFLTGRFDLLLAGARDGRPAVTIYDWKTSRPRTAQSLRSDWQTRLYLALVAESGDALLPSKGAPAPGDIALVYWYASAADEPRLLRYEPVWHQQNWGEILTLVAEIEAMDPDQIWPLTGDLQRCRSCMYQSYCGRQHAGTAAFLAEEEAGYTAETALLLEPQLP